MNNLDDAPVFLSGATGFVGSSLYPRLREAGWEVRCGTRSVDRARNHYPDRKWVRFDVEEPAMIRRALEGCRSAYYLVHQMGGGGNYREKEGWSALSFRRAAEEVGVERIVYLGGVAPRGEASEHLISRLETGEILRGGDVSTVELRAAMIIGKQSASWQIVRDLAARLPVMILPRWTRSRSEPVYIDDVLDALVAALTLETDGSEWFDIPGPEAMTVEEILVRTARQMGHSPRQVGVPLLSPRLSSYWLRFVTNGDLGLARELVEGLKSDLLAEDDEFWHRIDHPERIGYDDAVRRMLGSSKPPSIPGRLYEWLVGRVAPEPNR